MQQLDFVKIEKYIFKAEPITIEWQSSRVDKSHHRLLEALEKKETIYGVTTGFGDSSSETIPIHYSYELQKNLVSYLLCGTGDIFPIEVSRAVLVYRLISLSRGYSGVSKELLERMQMLIDKEIVPVIPKRGSLGASGDLVPLAYLARVVEGHGSVYWRGQICEMTKISQELAIEPYQLKPKEGLALVNGTSVMAAAATYNLKQIKYLLENNIIASAMLCIALNGRKDSFSKLVNEKAKNFSGQSWVAKRITDLLDEESYVEPKLSQIQDRSESLGFPIQDRYSLRCVPQILGPIYETIQQVEKWVQLEIEGVSDNPLIDDQTLEFSMGGNFYGGYISQGMDYLKICLCHLADMMDRQMIFLIDPKANRGLPANLVSSQGAPIHHGLKGVHQAMSAVTSELIAKAFPNGALSRSSESHNQDKVSLGLSACVQCSNMLDEAFDLMTFHHVAIAQALDLREHKIKSKTLKKTYDQVRQLVPFISRDTPLGENIKELRSSLLKQAKEAFIYENTI